ncbi:MAG: hypothetical protein KJ592_05265 [Nanoarchaeota archaeon]|nr:hypothetical protein [Nanoarchaeota archaeon]
MVNITLAVDEDLKRELSEFNEVNWSAVIRKALRNHLRKLQIAEVIANKSKFTKDDVKEIGDLIKKGIAENHEIK